MQKIGILKATICDLGQWRQSHHPSSTRPSQSRFNSFMKLATNYRKKGSSLALCKIHYNQTTGCLAKVHSMSDQRRTSGSILQKRERENSKCDLYVLHWYILYIKIEYRSLESSFYRILPFISFVRKMLFFHSMFWFSFTPFSSYQQKLLPYD